MPLTRLLISDFRNLQAVELAPAREFNFIEGANGSGKTSLLEAISTLAMGRSFRTRKFRNIIGLEREAFSLFAELGQEDATHHIGVSRPRSGQSRFKLDNRMVNSAAELAEILPFQIINSQSFSLLEGGPSERRRFLDWMVFHVKHSYRQVWSDYARCLKQRNTLLRSDKMDRFGAITWDATLSDLAEKIDAMRKEVVEIYLPNLERYLTYCGFMKAGRLKVEYQRGWSEGSSLKSELEEVRHREEKIGHTTVGPHKADLKIRFNRKDVAELYSRGQQKSIVAAMYMAQLDVFKQKNKRSCVLLIDDLPAELDAENQKTLCRWVASLDRVQTFITGIDLQPIIQSWPSDLTASESKMFHVKHGQVTEHWSNP